MTTREDKRSWLSSTGHGFVPVLVVGCLAGLFLVYELLEDPFIAPAQSLLSLGTIGVVFVFLLLQGADLISQGLAFYKDPIPMTLNMANRHEVKTHLLKVKGEQLLTSRCKHLLESWSMGWQPNQVMALAAYQSARAKPVLWGGIAFAALVLYPCIWLGHAPFLTSLAFVFLGLTVFARMTLLTRIDYYIETHVLRKLPTNIPHTEVTAADLGGALRIAIDNAFDRAIPKPGDMSAAISTAIKMGAESIAKNVVHLQKAFVENQAVLMNEWLNAEKESGKQLSDVEKALTTTAAEVEKALTTTAAELTTGLGASTEKLKTSLVNQAAQLDTSLSKLAREMTAGYETGTKELKKALGDHAKHIQSANQNLEEQLKKIIDLGKEIEKVYHVQQMVDGTLKSVSSTDEFKDLIGTLRNHLEASDRLLQEAAKPRTIRLVETGDGMVSESTPAVGS